MLTYALLKEKPKEFLAATGLTLDEFERLLPVFRQNLDALSPSPEHTKSGQVRKRRIGAGPKERLRTVEDKLLFILVYQKTYPLQTMHGLQFGLSQSRTNYWIHRLMPILQQTLAEIGPTPERNPKAVADSPLVQESAPDLLIGGTERRRQRPKDAKRRAEYYSGKKKAHTDKNVLPVNSPTQKVVYLSPTESGKKHDKKIANENGIVYPSGATLGKDSGFQGYEPGGVVTYQPKKAKSSGLERGGSLAERDDCRGARYG